MRFPNSLSSLLQACLLFFGLLLRRLTTSNLAITYNGLLLIIVMIRLPWKQLRCVITFVFWAGLFMEYFLGFVINHALYDSRFNLSNYSRFDAVFLAINPQVPLNPFGPNERSNFMTWKQLQPHAKKGDIIEFRREYFLSPYLHWGIYDGDKREPRVIHFVTNATTPYGVIEYQRIERVLSEGPMSFSKSLFWNPEYFRDVPSLVRINNLDRVGEMEGLNRKDPNLVVDKALEWAMESNKYSRRYDKYLSNCEHFVTEVSYGKPFSIQSDKFFSYFFVEMFYDFYILVAYLKLGIFVLDTIAVSFLPPAGDWYNNPYICNIDIDISYFRAALIYTIIFTMYNRILYYVIPIALYVWAAEYIFEAVPAFIETNNELSYKSSVLDILRVWIFGNIMII